MAELHGGVPNLLDVEAHQVETIRAGAEGREPNYDDHENLVTTGKFGTVHAVTQASAQASNPSVKQQGINKSAHVADPEQYPEGLTDQNSVGVTDQVSNNASSDGIGVDNKSAEAVLTEEGPGVFPPDAVLVAQAKLPKADGSEGLVDGSENNVMDADGKTVENKAPAKKAAAKKAATK